MKIQTSPPNFALPTCLPVTFQLSLSYFLLRVFMPFSILTKHEKFAAFFSFVEWRSEEGAAACETAKKRENAASVSSDDRSPGLPLRLLISEPDHLRGGKKGTDGNVSDSNLVLFISLAKCYFQIMENSSSRRINLIIPSCRARRAQ